MPNRHSLRAMDMVYANLGSSNMPLPVPRHREMQRDAERGPWEPVRQQKGAVEAGQDWSSSLLTKHEWGSGETDLDGGGNGNKTTVKGWRRARMEDGEACTHHFQGFTSEEPSSVVTQTSPGRRRRLFGGCPGGRGCSTVPELDKSGGCIRGSERHKHGK